MVVNSGRATVKQTDSQANYTGRRYTLTKLTWILNIYCTFFCLTAQTRLVEKCFDLKIELLGEDRNLAVMEAVSNSLGS